MTTTSTTNHPSESEDNYESEEDPLDIILQYAPTLPVVIPRRNVNYQLIRQLHAREIHPNQYASQRAVKESVAKKFVPNSFGVIQHTFEDRLYCGRFSDDGSIYYACSNGFTIRLFDARDPLKLRPIKCIHTGLGRWTISDVALWRDNQALVYSSLTPVLYMVKTNVDSDHGPELQILNLVTDVDRSFGIWSIRISGDGREIIAGTSNGTINIYDVTTQKVVVRQAGHEDDVNAVCYADANAPHIMYSGSDDSLIHVWDRRIMSDNVVTPVGTFPGHLEGITFIDSKGDGRYCVSNGKDQTAKLWDIRKMMSWSSLHDLPRVDYRRNWDYRYMPYPGKPTDKHPHDRSVQTFRGHTVLRTLIRCYFSPAFTTGQRYIYTGSENGIIHIYNLDGTIRQKLNANYFKESIQSDSYRYRGYILYERENTSVVRDVSWHPHMPVIASTAWYGRRTDRGGIGIHKYESEREGKLEVLIQ